MTKATFFFEILSKILRKRFKNCVHVIKRKIPGEVMLRLVYKQKSPSWHCAGRKDTPPSSFLLVVISSLVGVAGLVRRCIPRTESFRAEGVMLYEPVG